MDKKPVIIGFSRCGQTALSKYLKCAHPEIAYGGTQEWLQNYPNTYPVIITRDPIDRLWSMYNYHLYFKTNRMSFDEFLDFDGGKQWEGVGLRNPLEQCDYNKYIEPFEPYGVIVYKLEELLKLPDFPKDPRGQSKIEMPLEYRKMVEERLSSLNISY